MPGFERLFVGGHPTAIRESLVAGHTHLPHRPDTAASGLPPRRRSGDNDRTMRPKLTVVTTGLLGVAATAAITLSAATAPPQPPRIMLADNGVAVDPATPVPGDGSNVDGQPVRSCQTFIEDVAGAKVTTIEGLDSKAAAAVQKAWGELDVVQCGYCQSGQIMSAVGLLSSNPKPTDDDINSAMSGNVCRCATYVRIRAAIHRAAEIMEG